MAHICICQKGLVSYNGMTPVRCQASIFNHRRDVDKVFFRYIGSTWNKIKKFHWRYILEYVMYKTMPIFTKHQCVSKHSFVSIFFLWIMIVRKAPSHKTKFMGPTWGRPGSCRPETGPIVAPWTLLSGYVPYCDWWLSWQRHNSLMIFSRLCYIAILKHVLPSVHYNDANILVFLWNKRCLNPKSWSPGDNGLNPFVIIYTQKRWKSEEFISFQSNVHFTNQNFHKIGELDQARYRDNRGLKTTAR